MLKPLLLRSTLLAFLSVFALGNPLPSDLRSTNDSSNAAVKRLHKREPFDFANNIMGLAGDDAIRLGPNGEMLIGRQSGTIIEMVNLNRAGNVVARAGSMASDLSGVSTEVTTASLLEGPLAGGLEEGLGEVAMLSLAEEIAMGFVAVAGPLLFAAILVGFIYDIYLMATSESAADRARKLLEQKIVSSSTSDEI